MNEGILGRRVAGALSVASVSLRPCRTHGGHRRVASLVSRDCVVTVGCNLRTEAHFHREGYQASDWDQQNFPVPLEVSVALAILIVGNLVNLLCAAPPLPIKLQTNLKAAGQVSHPA